MSEVRHGTSSVHFHCLAPRSSNHISRVNHFVPWFLSGFFLKDWACRLIHAACGVALNGSEPQESLAPPVFQSNINRRALQKRERERDVHFAVEHLDGSLGDLLLCLLSTFFWSWLQRILTNIRFCSRVLGLHNRCGDKVSAIMC